MFILIWSECYAFYMYQFTWCKHTHTLHTIWIVNERHAVVYIQKIHLLFRISHLNSTVLFVLDIQEIYDGSFTVCFLMVCTFGNCSLIRFLHLLRYLENYSFGCKTTYRYDWCLQYDCLLKWKLHQNQLLGVINWNQCINSALTKKRRKIVYPLVLVRLELLLYPK